jgi:hypothetical protein
MDGHPEFPNRKCPPGNDQLAGVHGNDIGAAVTVKIAEQQATDRIPLGVEVPPFSGAAVAIEVAGSGIGCSEIVVAGNIDGERGRTAGEGHAKPGARMEDHSIALALERNIAAVKICVDFRIASQPVVCALCAEKRVSDDIDMDSPHAAITTIPDSVHIEVLTVEMVADINIALLILRGVRKDEVRGGSVLVMRLAVAGDCMAIQQESVPFDKRSASPTCNQAVAALIFFVVVQELRATCTLASVAESSTTSWLRPDASETQLEHVCCFCLATPCRLWNRCHSQSGRTVRRH